MISRKEPANYIIHCDGSNSHPKGAGPAGAAFVVLDAATGSEYTRGKRCHPSGTNNKMELTAILAALEWSNLHTNMVNRVKIITDSQWATYTLAKVLKLDYLPHYDTKHYPGIFDQIKILWEKDRMTLAWVKRSLNKIADEAAKAATEDAKQIYKK